MGNDSSSHMSELTCKQNEELQQKISDLMKQINHAENPNKPCDQPFPEIPHLALKNTNVSHQYGLAFTGGGVNLYAGTNCVDYVCKIEDKTYDFYFNPNVTYGCNWCMWEKRIKEGHYYLNERSAAQFNNEWAWDFIGKRSSSWPIIKAIRSKLAELNPIPMNILKAKDAEQYSIKLETLEEELALLKEQLHGCKPGEHAFIQDNMRMLQQKNTTLQSRIFFKGRHPIMALFEMGKNPKFEDDSFVKIDLIYSENDKTKKRENVVRFEAKMYGSHMEKKGFKWKDKIFDVNKPLMLVRRFCVDYQKENKLYSVSTNNCRRFMMKLCRYVGAEFNNSFPCEELMYDSTAWTGKSTNDDGKGTSCVVM